MRMVKNLMGAYILISALMSTSASADQSLPQVTKIHNVQEMHAVLSAGFANVSIFRGNGFAVFRRNFTRTLNPEKRTQECFMYSSFIAPDAWGEVMGTAAVELGFDSLREYAVYAARDASGGLENILIGTAIRAIFDSHGAYDRAHDRIHSLTASCFNGGDDGTVTSTATQNGGAEEEASKALAIGPNDMGDWWMPAIGVRN